LTVNGVQYGLPASANFWILLEVLHELGHNVAAPHSSCVALSPAEQAQHGVVGRGFVDLCLSGGTGCYSGSTSAPAEKGSIMSYCHNFTSGGFRQSRYLFGKAGEPSEKMLPIFKYGQAQPGFNIGPGGMYAERHHHGADSARLVLCRQNRVRAVVQRLRDGRLAEALAASTEKNRPMPRKWFTPERSLLRSTHAANFMNQEVIP
jgi:hypothetical protein